MSHFVPNDAVVFDPLCGEKKLSEYDKICDIRVFMCVRERTVQ